MMLLERELSETKATADRKQRLKLVSNCTGYNRQDSNLMIIYKTINFPGHIGLVLEHSRPNQEVLGWIPSPIVMLCP